MGEVYWPDIQNNAWCSSTRWLAQTFRPTFSFNLQWVKVKLSTLALFCYLKIAVQYLKPDGTPTGVDLANFYLSTLEMSPAWTFSSWMMQFAPISLVKGIDYALVLYTDGIPGFDVVLAKFKGLPSYYPRGKLIVSSDCGNSWDTTETGDLLFGVWGNPYVIPSAKTPPIDKFAVLDESFIPLDIGIITTLQTNVPCHLTCYWTDKKPGKHPVSRTIRGIDVPWYTYFCFVAWHAVEQTEDGDTLCHTFNLSPWEICQTRWFTFRGNVDTALTPSVGPIFEHHLEATILKNPILRPNAPGDRCHARITGNGLPCPDHWQTVDDVVPDEEATQLVGATINKWWGKDLYHIEALDPSGLPIESVKITARWKALPGYAYVHVNGIGLKTNGTEYWPSTVRDVFSWYHDYSRTFTKNPITGEDWTIEEVNNLQIGVQLRHTWGVGWWRDGYCTQLYATINRKSSPCL